MKKTYLIILLVVVFCPYSDDIGKG